LFGSSTLLVLVVIGFRGVNSMYEEYLLARHKTAHMSYFLKK
jgi:hypothetical protein